VLIPYAVLFSFFEHIFCKVLTHTLNRRDGEVVHNIKQG